MFRGFLVQPLAALSGGDSSLWGYSKPPEGQCVSSPRYVGTKHVIDHLASLGCSHDSWPVFLGPRWSPDSGQPVGRWWFYWDYLLGVLTSWPRKVKRLIWSICVQLLAKTICPQKGCHSSSGFDGFRVFHFIVISHPLHDPHSNHLPGVAQHQGVPPGFLLALPCCPRWFWAPLPLGFPGHISSRAACWQMLPSTWGSPPFASNRMLQGQNFIQFDWVNSWDTRIQRDHLQETTFARSTRSFFLGQPQIG